MDKRIRKNEVCVIGQPRCDYVFSAGRTAFIGYGFEESPMEMDLLKHILRDNKIDPVEAGGDLAPAQNAFCAKICSKIITSQFCIVLLNNDVKGEQEIPNANVNMEYGLMLGFNKYIIPFQRAEQRLPFNVAGLDTVKYTKQDFAAKARKAVETAVAATVQEEVPRVNPDQQLLDFLLAERMLLAAHTAEPNTGESVIYRMGQPLGYNLLMTFDGLHYAYLGIFTALRPEGVVWRLGMLHDILTARLGSIAKRIEMGMPGTQPAQLKAWIDLMQQLQVWVLVTSDDDKAAVIASVGTRNFMWPVRVFAMSDIRAALERGPAG